MKHKGLPLDGQLEEQNMLFTQWNLVSLKKKEILRNAAAWVNLEGTKVKEISLSQEDKQISQGIPLLWHHFNTLGINTDPQVDSVQRMTDFGALISKWVVVINAPSTPPPPQGSGIYL